MFLIVWLDQESKKEQKNIKYMWIFLHFIKEKKEKKYMWKFLHFNKEENWDVKIRNYQ